MTLTEFLLARIAEDETVARAAITNGYGAMDWADDGDPTDIHIARWDPARVLAECESKRRNVELHMPYPVPQRMVRGDIIACSTCGDVDDNPTEWPCDTVRALVLPYAEHPDCREEWKP